MGMLATGSRRLFMGVALGLCGLNAAAAQDRSFTIDVGRCSGSAKHSIARVKSPYTYSCASSAAAYSPWQKPVPGYCQVQANSIAAIGLLADLGR